jgi:ribosomal protein L35
MQSHNLEKKSSKRKRSFRKDTALAESDYPALRKMFGRKKAIR